MQGGLKGINGGEWIKVIYGLVLSTVLGFIAGFIIASLRTKSNMVTGTLIAYVDDMFVHPSYRGQKIATTLFHEMEQKAKELGATRIDLMVWEFNESAQELYRSLGMTPQRYILEKLL